MEKLDLTSPIRIGTQGTLTIVYDGNLDEPFGEIKLKDLKEERRVFEYVVMAIDNVFVGVPDLEMAVLREQTNIQKFFDATQDMLSDDQIEKVFDGFEVFLSEK